MAQRTSGGAPPRGRLGGERLAASRGHAPEADDARHQTTTSGRFPRGPGSPDTERREAAGSAAGAGASRCAATDVTA